MRIFQVLEDSANGAVAGNQTWYRNLHEPLVELGHEVHLMSVTEGRLAMERGDAAARTRFSEKMVETFHREHARRPFALFWSYLMEGMVDPEALAEIRAVGVPTCNFSCNNAHQFHLAGGLAKYFDYNLHAEKDAARKFRAAGVNPLWWPMASNPRYFKPMDKERTVQASFVGANYGLRARYVAHLLDNGIDVQAFGPGWLWGASSAWRAQAKRLKYALLALAAQSAEARAFASAHLADHDFRRRVALEFPDNVHRPVSDEKLIALYSESLISLGFLEVYDHHDPSRPVTQHLHLREFEAPMCGALYCTGYMDELAEMFEPDKEVLTYRNQHELLDKVRYYLAHPQDADRIREAGHQRALRDHTYQRRFQQLFAHLSLS